MIGARAGESVSNKGEAVDAKKSLKKKKSFKDILTLTNRKSTTPFGSVVEDEIKLGDNLFPQNSSVVPRPAKNIREMFGKGKLERKWDAILKEKQKDFVAAGGRIERIPLEDTYSPQQHHPSSTPQSPMQQKISAPASPNRKLDSPTRTDPSQSPTEVLSPSSASSLKSSNATKKKPRRKPRHSIEAAKHRNSHPTPEPPMPSAAQLPLTARGTRHRGRDSLYKEDSTLREQCRKIIWNPISDIGESNTSEGSSGSRAVHFDSNKRSGLAESSLLIDTSRHDKKIYGAKHTLASGEVDEAAHPDPDHDILSIIGEYEKLGDAIDSSWDVDGQDGSIGITKADNSQLTMSNKVTNASVGEIEMAEAQFHAPAAQTNELPETDLAQKSLAGNLPTVKTDGRPTTFFNHNSFIGNAATTQTNDSPGTDHDYGSPASNQNSRNLLSDTSTPTRHMDQSQLDVVCSGQTEVPMAVESKMEAPPHRESNGLSEFDRLSSNDPSKASESLIDQQNSLASSSPLETAPSSWEISSPISTNYMLIHKSELWYPPKLLSPTEKHDEYGFLKTARGIPIDDYNSWYLEHKEYCDRRTEKWVRHLNNNKLDAEHPTKFPSPSIKTQRFVRKGIPSKYRGEAWYFYAGGPQSDDLRDLQNAYMGTLNVCHSPYLRIKDQEAIERDLHRTFPDNVHFKPLLDQSNHQSMDRSEAPIVSALRRVLYIFAMQHAAVGYCQSLNFIAGLLLLFMSEVKACWMLGCITTSILPGSHDRELEGARVDTWVLMAALRAKVPRAWEKVSVDVPSNSRSQPAVTTILSRWLMSIFISELPIEGVLRVWDILFYQGAPRILFSLALSIFHEGANELENLHDVTDVLQVVQNLPRKMVDVGRLFELAFSSCDVSNRWIKKKRQQRRKVLKDNVDGVEDRSTSLGTTPSASPTVGSGGIGPCALLTSAER